MLTLRTGGLFSLDGYRLRRLRGYSGGKCTESFLQLGHFCDKPAELCVCSVQDPSLLLDFLLLALNDLLLTVVASVDGETAQHREGNKN